MRKFDSTPSSLYTINQLFAGYQPGDVESFVSTPDFQIYMEFVADGGAASTNKPVVLARAEHDCSIMQLLAKALSDGKVVAMMGGHAVARNTQAYADMATTAAILSEEGFLVMTGGGPGAMEAAHLGAMVGHVGAELDDALRHMSNGPPDCKGLPVVYTGDPNKPVLVKEDVVKALDEYYAHGWKLRQKYPDGGGVAIPTWMYGWEPTTVFARSVGKYFQNSIREDGLLAAATHGIVYAEGKAGTLQEVFQYAAQNYYRSFPAPPEAGKGIFSPMVFLGDFWTSDEPTETRKNLPVKHLLDKLWAAGSIDASRLVSFVRTPKEAATAITNFSGPTVAPAIAISIATAKN